MPTLLKLSPQQSTLPAWVRAMTQGAVGPGDLSNPIEAPLTVAAQSPALMRKMGEALLERLSKRGDVPENLMAILRDLQGRWPRLFGHLDDVRIGPVPSERGMATAARVTNRAEEGLEPRHLMLTGEFDRDVDNPVWHELDQMNATRADALAKEQEAATRRTNKYSTMYIDPSREHIVPGGLPEMAAHELLHGAHRVADPNDFVPKYRAQFAANTELTKDPFEGYKAITYEKNAELGGARYAKEYEEGKRRFTAFPRDPSVSKRVVSMQGRAGDAGTPKLSLHPTLEQIQNKYNREALIEQMARKLSGGQ